MIEINTMPLRIVVSTNGNHEFLNWDEVDAFISELRAKAKDTFGPNYSDPKYDI